MGCRDLKGFKPFAGKYLVSMDQQHKTEMRRHWGLQKHLLFVLPESHVCLTLLGYTKDVSRVWHNASIFESAEKKKKAKQRKESLLLKPGAWSCNYDAMIRKLCFVSFGPARVAA